MSELVEVKPHDEFEDRSREIIEVDGDSIGVIRIDDEFYALRNQCAHEGGPVCRGEVRNKLVAEQPEQGKLFVEDFSGEKTIACPWHGYTYDLATGEHIGDSTYGVETYDVVIEDGMVCVEV